MSDKQLAEWESECRYAENSDEFCRAAIPATEALFSEIRRLKEAVKVHHSQRADDLCWMDDHVLYAAFGLPPRDNSVGDPNTMLENCRRFVRQRCQGGGPWKSYAELMAENEELRKQVEALTEYP